MLLCQLIDEVTKENSTEIILTTKMAILRSSDDTDDFAGLMHDLDLFMHYSGIIMRGVPTYV